jgi:hypothetical protein
VDLGLAGTTASPVVWLAARWSWALIVGGGDGGMVMVRKQEMIRKHNIVELGSRVHRFLQTNK